MAGFLTTPRSSRTQVRLAVAARRLVLRLGQLPSSRGSLAAAASLHVRTKGDKQERPSLEKLPFRTAVSHQRYMIKKVTKRVGSDFIPPARYRDRPEIERPAQRDRGFESH